MKLICKTTLLAAVPPFAGSVLGVRVGAGRKFRIRHLTLADMGTAVTVEWGDGTRNAYTSDQSNLEHAFPAPGDYAIRISEDLKHLVIGDSDETSEACTVYAPMVTGFFSNAGQLTSIASYAFQGCVNLRSVDVAAAPVEMISSGAFKNCAALTGELRFPHVVNFRGGESRPPFAGCAGITALHFAAANEAAIRSSAAYVADPTLGSGVANVCRFDL